VKALVTGATGFVGSHLVEHLRARGDEITALVRNPSKAGLLTSLGVRLERGDLHDHAALTRAAAGQDVVFHVAGAVAAPDEAAYMSGNRDGTANVVRAAERSGAPRFVLVSSMAAGGPAVRGHPRRGDEPSRPVTAYGRSKLAAEAVVRACAIPWVIMRPPTVYGPRDRDNLIKVFRIARSGLAPVFGDGSMELSAVYAPDLAEALALAGYSPATTTRTYYPNHPEILTSRQLVEAIGRAMGRRVRVVGLPESVARRILALTGSTARLLGRTTILNAEKANEFFQEAWTGDPSPLSNDTGWRAAHDIEAGLARTYAWYRSAGWLA
jgi:nucleoside-diphosphate-sugar epimerase